MDETKSIFHVGVLGMKWGRRKASGPSSDEHKALRELKGKQAHELTNLQIRKAAERIQLEKQYKTLTAKELNPVAKMVQDILKDQGKMAVTSVVASSAALLGKYIVDHQDVILDAAAQMIKIVPKSG